MLLHLLLLLLLLLLVLSPLLLLHPRNTFNKFAAITTMAVEAATEVADAEAVPAAAAGRASKCHVKQQSKESQPPSCPRAKKYQNQNQK